jgi:putative nucleotidyltransferase with HDIG domain
MELAPKSRSRRAEIRKNRPDTLRFDWQELKASGVPMSVGIVVAFFLLAYAILMLRQDVIPYRPDQPITHDIVSRVAFVYPDKNKLALEQDRAKWKEPRVYQLNDIAGQDAWERLEKDLLSLPDRAAAGPEPPADIKRVFDDPGSQTALRLIAAGDGRQTYMTAVSGYVNGLRTFGNGVSRQPLIVLADEDRKEDARVGRAIRIGQDTFDPQRTYAIGEAAKLQEVLEPLAERFFPRKDSLRQKLVEHTLAVLGPTHRLDMEETTRRRNEAAAAVPHSAGLRHFQPNEILVHRSRGKLTETDWQLLRGEHQKYVSELKGATWKPMIGTGFLALMVTVVLWAYVAHFQPRVVRNHARAVAIAALLLSMLLLAALGGVGNGPIYLFGVAPTLLVAMILAIAYDRRFAIGVSTIHGLLVTVVLGQGVTFFLILWVGVLTTCFLLDDIRTRSKLVEVGGASALAMMAATAAAGLLAIESPAFIVRNCLYAGAAGLAVGFVILGILPFVEKAFRITTSMTLLEMADASQPLLRRLNMEAPGTYNHSLQVATIAEAAAEAVGANSLLCRVASYYHDVGKINKAEYFIENQQPGVENRHINLTPNVSYYIITGHVKDGVELAREYNLPNSIIPFIQQHHGTTLIEYFYGKACQQQQQQCAIPGGESQAVAEHEFRYPGPKPRTKEVAIVMIADCVESATRCMGEPTASRVQSLVHDLSMKRLLDGQFDECDLTMRELELIEKAVVKTVLGIYHGRIAYPSQSQPPAQASEPGFPVVMPSRGGASAGAAARTA